MEENNNLTSGHINDADTIAYLITGYIRSTLSDSERDQLDEWVTADEKNMELFARLTAPEQLDESLKLFNSFNSQAAIESIKRKMNESLKTETLPSLLRRLIPFSIAASLILITTVFIIYQKNKPIDKPHIIAEKPDIQPGANKALLTLSDGKQIVLDSAGIKKLHVGNLEISNDNGRLIYPPSSEGGNGAEVYNTLTTPKGGQYKLTLPDGSMVWLNASSSITYPIAFNSTVRKVQVTGEVYFEVSRDKAKPFKISLTSQVNTHSQNGEVEVLGTKFNINSYKEEAQSKVTLLEGSVKVSQLTTHESRIMKPGQQVTFTANGQLLTTNSNTEEVIAWKNGWFEFQNETIENIMHQVSRWYNVEVKYEGKVNFHFKATIERNLPVSNLLYLLEQTGNVHFEIKDKTIIVKP